MLARSVVDLTDEPGEVFLKDSLTLHGVGVADSVQAGLRSVGLPTTVKQLHAVFGDRSDVVTVQVDAGHVVVSVKMNGSVSRGPIAILCDGGVHLGFDLTHDAWGVV